MRIISGALGGRRFQPPASMPHTRPTTDIAKEGLFNMLQNQVSFGSLRTLDLFGGTGSITYELASRGVTDLTIVEKDAAMFSFIKHTLESFRISGVRPVRADVFRFLQQCQETFDLIFAGPPYALADIDSLPRLIFERKLLRKSGWFILEHTPRNGYAEWPYFKSQRNYGTTVFSFFLETRD
ncbi:MAG: hypothetical protein RJA57_545 [Bacteroidota bacterium]|jgi:16S rRNA (guanine(966)-N(2))-methyltransferase RsmD